MRGVVDHAEAVEFADHLDAGGGERAGVAGAVGVGGGLPREADHAEAAGVPPGHVGGGAQGVAAPSISRTIGSGSSVERASRPNSSPEDAGGTPVPRTIRTRPASACRRYHTSWASACRRAPSASAYPAGCVGDRGSQKIVAHANPTPPAARSGNDTVGVSPSTAGCPAAETAKSRPRDAM